MYMYTAPCINMINAIILADHLYNPNRSTKYTSAEIQNELLDVCAEQLMAAITERCNNAGFWSFIANDASDQSCREQISLNIRFVEQGADHTTMVQAEFLGFVRAHSTTGEALTKTFLESLRSLRLDLTQLRGQGYDGAANMLGHQRGVQARIARLVPEAHYVHCHAHVLNLVIVHNCKLPIVRNMMDTVQRISFVFGYSVKKLEAYQSCLQEADGPTCTKENMGRRTKIQQLCDTR